MVKPIKSSIRTRIIQIQSQIQPKTKTPQKFWTFNTNPDKNLTKKKKKPYSH